jgi:hypothetical protein
VRVFTSFSPKVIILLSGVIGFLALAILIAVAMGKFPRRDVPPASEPAVVESEAVPETYVVEIPSEWQEITPAGAEDRFVLRAPADAEVALVESNRWDIKSADGKKVLSMWWASDLDALSVAMKQASVVAPKESGPWLVQKEDMGWVVAQRLDDQKAPIEWIDAVLVSIKTR